MYRYTNLIKITIGFLPWKLPKFLPKIPLETIMGHVTKDNFEQEDQLRWKSVSTGY